MRRNVMKRRIMRKIKEFIKETLVLGTMVIGTPMLLFILWLVFGY